MGGLCGAGIIYANYIHAIDLVEGGRHIRTVPGTAGLFSTYAVCLLRAPGSLGAFAYFGVCTDGLHDVGVMLL